MVSDSLLKAASSSAVNDRGVIHQALVSLGVGNSTAHTVQVVADGPIRVVIVLVVAFVLTRLVGRASHRLVNSFRHVSPLVGATQRGADRASTLAGVFTSIFRALIWVIAVLTILGELGIDLGPFVATATVVGAAVGFGAQTLVKDFLSGVLILAEDQYGVGDSVTIVSSKTEGVVESVNLRTTRIRSVDGVVWYVPNGDIRAVGNNSESDSQALIDLVLPHGADLERAGTVARDAAAGLADDPDWGPSVTGPPSFAGIQDEDHEGITLRITVPTTAGKNVPVARQGRLRILEAWRAAGLGFETPLAVSSEVADLAATPTLAGVGAGRSAAPVEARAAEAPAVEERRGGSLGGSVGLPAAPAPPAPPTPRSGHQRPHLFRPHQRGDS